MSSYVTSPANSTVTVTQASGFGYAYNLQDIQQSLCNKFGEAKQVSSEKQQAVPDRIQAKLLTDSYESTKKNVLTSIGLEGTKQDLQALDDAMLAVAIKSSLAEAERAGITYDVVNDKFTSGKAKEEANKGIKPDLQALDDEGVALALAIKSSLAEAERAGITYDVVNDKFTSGKAKEANFDIPPAFNIDNIIEFYDEEEKKEMVDTPNEDVHIEDFLGEFDEDGLFGGDL